MGKISQELGEGTELWLSLHDTTPRVKALRQAVYCQTSFPFMKWRLRDFSFDPKIPLFTMLTKFAYRIGITPQSLPRSTATLAQGGVQSHVWD